MAFAPEPVRTPILRAAPPTGPGWVHATIAQRTYRQRLGWAQYDLAMLAENRIYIVRKGWKFVGARPRAPLCQVVAERLDPAAERAAVARRLAVARPPRRNLKGAEVAGYPGSASAVARRPLRSWSSTKS